MIFLDELVKRGLLQEGQVPEVIRIAEEKYAGVVDRALLDMNIDEGTLIDIKGAYYNIPVKKIDPKTVSPSTLKYIQLESVKTYGFIPIGLSNDILEVGITDP